MVFNRMSVLLQNKKKWKVKANIKTNMLSCDSFLLGLTGDPKNLKLYDTLEAHSLID